MLAACTGEACFVSFRGSIVAHPPPALSSAKQFREGLNLTNPSLDAGLAMIIKQRPKAGAIERMDLVGSVDGAWPETAEGDALVFLPPPPLI